MTPRLLTITRSAMTLALGFILGACASEAPSEAPPLERGPAYQVRPGSCGDDCLELTLYRFQGQSDIELRGHDAAGDYVDRSTGTLSPAAQALIDDTLDALEAGSFELGASPGAVPIDGPAVSMWLPALRLNYTQGYPPAGLEQLDELYAAVLADLSECRASERVEPDEGCVELGW